jgi:predicted permease
MLAIVYAILPIFLIIAAGILADRGGFLSASISAPLSAYVLRFALPTLVFRIMADADPSELFQGALWISLTGVLLITYGIGYAGDRVLKRRGAGPAAVTDRKSVV